MKEWKKYICPKCEGKVKLEYTELFSWNSKEEGIVKGELKCPKCKRIFWAKQKINRGGGKNEKTN
jgi:uncharacterized protein YbaR (Trm112 family)